MRFYAAYCVSKKFLVFLFVFVLLAFDWLVVNCYICCCLIFQPVWLPFDRYFTLFYLIDVFAEAFKVSL